MNYIVDANNLAGALDILKEENFDQLLIDKFIEYNQGKGRIVYLVFDGIEMMGDRMSLDDNIEVIYTPRDEYYKSADDKIVELVKLSDDKNELMVISDDIELRERVVKVAENKRNNIVLKRASNFIGRLNRPIEKKDNDYKDDNNVTDELIALWTKK